MNIIQVFEHIRDAPYNIPLSETEVNNSCSSKAYRLHQALTQGGYSARYRVCDFAWSDLPISKTILSVPHVDQGMHVYLEVCIQDNWIDIDPTWDAQLRHVFTISEWDGVSSTHIAVKPLRLYSHEESTQIMEQPDLDKDKEDIQKNGAFYKALNIWLESQRT